MRYLLFLLLACLAAVEYFHHLSDAHTVHQTAHATPQEKAEGVRDLLRRHLHNH
jgi:hypothetical protein